MIIRSQTAAASAHTMAIGSHWLLLQGAITKRMNAIEEMAGMDVLCSDKTGTLTLNNLSVDRSLDDEEVMLLLAARAHVWRTRTPSTPLWSACSPGGGGTSGRMRTTLFGLSKDTFWKSRDMGWKYGIMVDENRQHWKCMYCGLIRYGGGVSRLKRHLAGDLDVKMCPKVPANVAEEIRVHLRKKRERRRKQAAQNGGNNIKIKSSYDDGIIEKDVLPSDLVVPPKTDTNVLEEVSVVHQDPACPRVPLLRTRDIGWEHAVDLDGNKRRWQCKFCSLCRSGGVTALKAHLTDGSCPNVPKEISKKVSNFIQEKRAMRLLFSFAFTLDDDQVSDSQIQEKGTVQCENDQQPSRNTTHKCATNEETLD